MSSLPPGSIVLSIKHCRVCGHALEDRTGKPGRPTDFCYPQNGEETSPCSRLDKRFQEVAKLAQALIVDMEAQDEDPIVIKQRLMTLKSYLWSSANSATNKGKLIGQANAKRYGKTRSGWWRLAPV